MPSARACGIADAARDRRRASEPRLQSTLFTCPGRQRWQRPSWWSIASLQGLRRKLSRSVDGRISLERPRYARYEHGSSMAGTNDVVDPAYVAPQTSVSVKDGQIAVLTSGGDHDAASTVCPAPGEPLELKFDWSGAASEKAYTCLPPEAGPSNVIRDFFRQKGRNDEAALQELRSGIFTWPGATNDIPAADPRAAILGFARKVAPTTWELLKQAARKGELSAKTIAKTQAKGGRSGLATAKASLDVSTMTAEQLLAEATSRNVASLAVGAFDQLLARVGLRGAESAAAREAETALIKALATQAGSVSAKSYALIRVNWLPEPVRTKVLEAASRSPLSEIKAAAKQCLEKQPSAAQAAKASPAAAKITQAPFDFATARAEQLQKLAADPTYTYKLRADAVDQLLSRADSQSVAATTAALQEIVKVGGAIAEYALTRASMLPDSALRRALVAAARSQ